MRFFRSPRPPVRADAREAVRADLTRVVVLDESAPPVPRPDARPALRRIVAEALILQDEGSQLLADVRARLPLSELAPRGGPLARRFFELRAAVPPASDAETARQRQTIREVLDHHGQLIVMALDMLAMDWRSPAIVEQLEKLTGFGRPADRLEALYAELRAD